MNIPELPLGWLPLADVVAKTTVILLAAAIASIVLRRASAALRHLVWTLALSSALVLPIASFALPKWQLPLLTITASQTSSAPVSIPDNDVNSSIVAVPESNAARSLPALPQAQGRPEPSRGTAEAGSHNITRSSIFEGLSWQQTIAAMWLLGATVILARILVGLVAVRWLSTRTQEITDAAWLPMAREMARDMGVSARLRFL